jgi:hypothetical protein
MCALKGGVGDQHDPQQGCQDLYCCFHHLSANVCVHLRAACGA